MTCCQQRTSMRREHVYHFSPVFYPDRLGGTFPFQNLRIPPIIPASEQKGGRSVCILPLATLHFPPKPRSLDKTLLKILGCRAE
jgi:hypothetical protein